MAREYAHLLDDYEMLSPSAQRLFQAEQREMAERVRLQEIARAEYRLQGDEMGVHQRGQYPVDEPVYDLPSDEPDWVDLEEQDWVELEPEGRTIEYITLDDLVSSTSNNISYTGAENTTTGGFVTAEDINYALYGTSQAIDQTYSVSPAPSVPEPGDEDVIERIHVTDTRADDLEAIAEALGYQRRGWEGTYDSRFGLPLPPSVEVVREVPYGPTNPTRFFVILHGERIGSWWESEALQLEWADPIEMYSWRLHQLRRVIADAVRDNETMESDTPQAEGLSPRLTATEAAVMEEQSDGEWRG